MLGEQQQHQQDLEQQHTKTQQVNDQEDGEQHEQQCHICMHSMKEPSAVEGCGHKFCHSCIQQWVGSRQQPCCPVCRAEIKVLLLSDGSEQVSVKRATDIRELVGLLASLAKKLLGGPAESGCPCCCTLVDRISPFIFKEANSAFWLHLTTHIPDFVTAGSRACCSTSPCRSR
jgi:hypothetical protein